MATGHVFVAEGEHDDEAITNLLEAVDLLQVGSATSVLPALPAADTVLARTVTAFLQGAGQQSEVVTAPSPVAAFWAALGGERTRGWFNARHDDRSWQLPESLDASHRIVAVAQLLGDERKGALFLDVMARYLSLWHRARAFSKKTGPVEVNLGRQPEFFLMTCRLGQRVLALASTDIVAAELFAIGILVHLSGTADEQAGPWEDAMVQRATELELGVRLPREVHLHVVPNGEITAAMATVIIDVARRLGIQDAALPRFDPSD